MKCEVTDERIIKYSLVVLQVTRKDLILIHPSISVAVADMKMILLLIKLKALAQIVGSYCLIPMQPYVQIADNLVAKKQNNG